MPNQKQTEEQKSENLKEFSSVKLAVEYIDSLDISNLGVLRSTVIDNQEVLNDGNEWLAVAFRKILTSTNAPAKNRIKAVFQSYFDIRDDKEAKEEARDKARQCVAILSRAMRTATDVDAKKRGLWNEEFTVSVNTVNNNGNARFDERNHLVPESSESDKKEEEKQRTINSLDGAFDFILMRCNKEDFRALAQLIEQRFQLEEQELEYVFVNAKGKKPAHFEEKKVA